MIRFLKNGFRRDASTERTPEREGRRQSYPLPDATRPYVAHTRASSLPPGRTVLASVPVLSPRPRHAAPLLPFVLDPVHGRPLPQPPKAKHLPPLKTVSPFDMALDMGEPLPNPYSPNFQRASFNSSPVSDLALAHPHSRSSSEPVTPSALLQHDPWACFDRDRTPDATFKGVREVDAERKANVVNVIGRAQSMRVVSEPAP